MERSSTVGYILIFLLFIGFYYFNSQNQEELDAQKRQAEAAMTDSVTQVENNTPAIVENDTLLTSSDVKVADSNNLLGIEKPTEEILTLENDLLVIELSNIGGVPTKVNLKEYQRYDSTELLLFEKNQMQLGYTIPLANGTVINTSSLAFEAKKVGDNQVVMTAALAYNARIIQTYTMEPGSYMVDYDVIFENMRDVVPMNNRFAELTWTAAIQGQEKTLKDERSATTIYYKYSTDDDVDYLSETSSDDEELQSNVKWVSFKQKFFNQTLVNKSHFVEPGATIEIIEPEDEEAPYVKQAKAKFFIPLEKNTAEEAMQLYYGPNHYQTLKGLDLSMHKMIPLGWGIFGWVNKGIVIPIFNWLDNYFVSYGIIILLLTLIIKMALFFPMFKVYKSTAKMRLLKPELDEIKERTGGDMQKAQQEQMKLYKQAGVSPLGGCLPQLVQMPILFAMFRFFPSSIELRQERLWWAEDLSSYDSIYNFPGFEIPFYGDHISLFTLMMTAVTLIYTFMNSQNSGQMEGPMKSVMYIMPIMFLGFFNNYAAALSFYYFLSTCITIIQNFVIRKFVIDEDKLHKQIQESKKKKVNVKKSKFQKKLEDMAKSRGVDPKTGKPIGANKKKKKK